MQTAYKKKFYAELIFSIIYGALCGMELRLVKDPNDPNTQSSIGYLLLIMLTPAAFQQSCLFMLNTMVKDKENKMKETLKIMGLNKSVYALSYIVMQGITISITCFFMCLCIWVFNRG